MSLVLRNLDTNNEIPLSKETPLVIGRGEITGVSNIDMPRLAFADIAFFMGREWFHPNQCFYMK